MSDVEFIPVAPLGDAGDGTTADYARSRGRWRALPDGWLSAKDMREELMRIARVPEYDGAAGEALMAAMEDFIESRGSGAGREYRRAPEPPKAATIAQIMEADTARRADVERERFERELAAREAVHAERDKAVLDGNRRLWNELCAETVTPRLAALEARIAELEGQRPQHGELEAVGTASTPGPTPMRAPSEAPAEASEAPGEPGRAERVRRWMFGDSSPDEIERLLEADEDE